MSAILLKAGGFLFIIFIGYVLKRIGVFSVDDSQFLTKLIMRVTLPSAIFSGFKGLHISKTLLFVTAIGLVLNGIMIGVALVVARKKKPSEKAFFMINTSSYNIGNFTIPFTQAFFPPEALAVVCMFDVGNAFMCLGMTFALASCVASGESGFNFKRIGKTLVSSTPFMTHITMLTLCSLQIYLPDGVYTVVGMVGSANSFLAMLLIGILFAVHMKPEHARNIGEILFLRVLFSVIFALVIYYVLPLPLLIRQILVIVVFSPILSVAPVFSERCGYDKSVAAVLNSLAIPISMVAMTTLLIIFNIS